MGELRINCWDFVVDIRYTKYTRSSPQQSWNSRKGVDSSNNKITLSFIILLHYQFVRMKL